MLPNLKPWPYQGATTKEDNMVPEYLRADYERFLQEALKALQEMQSKQPQQH